MKFKPICLTRQCFNLCVCLDISLGPLKTLKEAHAQIIVSKMLSEQQGQGSHPEEISVAHELQGSVLSLQLCFASRTLKQSQQLCSSGNGVWVHPASPGALWYPAMLPCQNPNWFWNPLIRKRMVNHRTSQKVPKKLWVSLRKQCNDILIGILLPLHSPV